MRVHIFSDMEGVAGIVHGAQTTGGDSALYQEGRVLYTEEINAAVRGAKAAGATEIVVMDCHGAGGAYDFNSLVPDLLDPDCEYVVQREWTEYTGFLESGCDAALFVGMHAMAGTTGGVLAHTVSGQAWENLRFNGTLVGETGINAALCGHWGVPVVLVTGDRAVCVEATELLGDGRDDGRGEGRPRRDERPDEDAAEGARADRGGREGRRSSDLSAVKPWTRASPCEIAIEFFSPFRMEEYRNRKGVELTGPRSLVVRGDDWWTAWSDFFF